MLPENIHQPIICISFVYVQWYDIALGLSFASWPYATVNEVPCCTRTIITSLPATTFILMWRRSVQANVVPTGVRAQENISTDEKEKEEEQGDMLTSLSPSSNISWKLCLIARSDHILPTLTRAWSSAGAMTGPLLLLDFRPRAGEPGRKRYVDMCG